MAIIRLVLERDYMVYKQRQSSYELLRIISMFMIIGHHYVVHGIMHRYMIDEFVLWRTGNFVNKAFTSILYVGGRIGVGLFFAITGFFMVNKKRGSLKKIILEWLYYLILLFLLLAIFGIYQILKNGIPLKMVFSNILNSYVLLPISNYWWFVTVYVLLIFFLPVINLNINKLNQKGYMLLLVIILAFLAIFDYNSSYQSFTIGLFYYLLGGYIRKFKKPLSQKLKLVNVILICMLWIFSSLIIYKYYMYYNNGVVNQIENFLYFGILSPVIVYLIFRFFQSINIGSNKFINTISRTTFGIYLLHDSVFVRQMIWHGILQIDQNQYGSKYCIIYAIGTILLVFILCSLFDSLRIKFIESKMLHVYDRSKLFIKEVFFAD